MHVLTPSRRSLGTLATALLLGVVLPAAPALAQKVKTKEAPTAASAPISDVSVDIPEIEAVDANVDEQTLRDIFSGNLTEHAEALAGLSASSISIPTIVVDVTTTVDDETIETSVTFNDIELTDVTDGVAASILLSSMSMDAGENGTAEMNELTASNFNIGGVLGIYGLVERNDQAELETIYTDFNFAGGVFTAPEVTCTIGEMSVGEFKARPLAYSFMETMALVEQIDETEEEPSPEVMGALFRMYADMLTAFESSPATFGGLDCDGTDDEGRPITIAIGGGTLGGMTPGIYPALSIDGLEVTVDGDGSIAVGNFSMKQMDLSGVIELIQSAPEVIDSAWLEANARALIPAFEGFSFADVSVDLPDPEAPGDRIQASIGAFDLTLGAYRNGIPTQVKTSASNIVVDLPEDSDDEQLQQLLALGVTSIDAGFAIDAAWNEADSTIVMNDVSVSGVDLATIKLAGTITNATEALFGIDENEAMAAAMAVAIRNLSLDVTDEGLSDIILAAASAEQGGTPEAMRPVFAGLAEGTIVGMLAGAAEAQKVGAAVSAFVAGKAKHLTIDLTAKEEPGLGMMDFMAAEEDPTVLIGKVTIDATAK